MDKEEKPGVHFHNYDGYPIYKIEYIKPQFKEKLVLDLDRCIELGILIPVGDDEK